MARSLRWLRFTPILLASVIVYGDLSGSFPFGGFNYYVLHLPYTPALYHLSDLLIIAIATFPLISSRKGWHYYIYIILAIFALAVLSKTLSFRIAALFWEPEGLREQSESIFFSRTVELITSGVLSIYLLWSLTFASVSYREIGLISVALAMSAVLWM